MTSHIRQNFINNQKDLFLSRYKKFEEGTLRYERDQCSKPV